MTPNLPFTSTLRARPAGLHIGTAGERHIVFRVQVAEAWDALRVHAPDDTSVAEVKRRAIEELLPDGEPPEDYLVKLAGWEVLDEQESLAAAGVKEGSTLLVAARRRRPVR